MMTYGSSCAELLSFPVGRHDEQVDAVGLMRQLLDMMAEIRRVSLKHMR